MSRFGAAAPCASSANVRTTCSSASAFLNSLVSRPLRSPLAIPARSTTSNVANVVFLGLNIPLSRSTRGSGTRATPVCSSVRPVS